MPKNSTKVPLSERRERLRAFRKKNRMSLAEFGKLAGLSQPMLSQFENGDRELSEDAWRRVQKAMDRHLDKNAVQQRGRQPLMSLFANAPKSEWGKLAPEYERELRRWCSGASVDKIAKEAKIPVGKMLRYEAGRVELTADEKNRLADALRDAQREKSARGDSFHAEDFDFDKVFAAIKGGDQNALFRLYQRYFSDIPWEALKSPGKHAAGAARAHEAALPTSVGEWVPSAPATLDGLEANRGRCEYRRDLLARMEKAESLADPVFGEIKACLKRDIQSMEAALAAAEIPDAGPKPD